MDINDITKLIQLVSDQGLTFFELEQSDIKIKMKKEKDPVPAAGPVAAMAAPLAPAAPIFMPSSAPEVFTGSAPAEGASSEVQPVVIPSSESANIVKSPLVGTFYNAPNPESDVFVKVGDTVHKGQVLGIVEAMKLMNEIESDFDGVVEAVLVENEAVVEYGQPLFKIR